MLASGVKRKELKMMYYLVIADEYQLAEKAFPATEAGKKRMSDLAAYLRMYNTFGVLYYGNEVLS